MKKLIKFLDNLPLVISGTALTLSIILCFVNVIGRYFFSFTFNGFSAVMTLCFAYCVFVGSGAAYRYGMHYGVDVFVASLSPGGKAISKVLLDVLMILIMAFGTYLSFVLSLKATSKTLEGLNISYFWYDLSAVIGFAYSFIWSLIFMIKDYKKMRAILSHHKNGGSTE
ncbi:MAG: TRAP transporter small permease subunit [Clostridiales bacterium]|nr:TRAP transporter small permease subunit [Clostridiales bacterium]